MALDILIEIKEEGEKDVDWFYRVGYSYFFLNKFEEAVDVFERCLELDPEDIDAKLFIKDSKHALHFGKYLNFSNKNPMIPSFLKRCDNFWNWFSNNEETLSSMVKNEKEYEIEDIIDFVSCGTNLIYDKISFNLGGDYEFNFTAEGKVPHFYLMPFLISRMPQEHKEKWKFSPFSKGCNGADQDFNIYGKEVKFSEVKVNIDFDKDSQTFSVIYFNEKLNELDYNKSINAFCIMIDLMLGEAISHSYIGCVTRTDVIMETMLPLTQMEDKIRKHLIDNNITISENPDKNYCIYKMEPKQSGEFRMDVEIGTSCYQELISDYYSNNTNSYYDILECGAYPLYISVSFWENRNNLPETEKEIVKLRHTLEDKIQNTILGERGSSNEQGIVIGGAMGTSTFYIDLLLYDMEGFEEQIEKLIEKEYGLSYYLFDFRRSHLRKLIIDITDVKELYLSDEMEELYLSGAPINNIKVYAKNEGNNLLVGFKEKIMLNIGCKKLSKIQCYKTEEVDIDEILLSYPDLMSLRLWGKPGYIRNFNTIKSFNNLETFTLVDMFGFTADDIPKPEEMPKLTWFWMSSLPEEAAKEARRLYKKEAKNGMDVWIKKARKPEWLAQNLENPFRAWDGQENIPVAMAKKATLQYKKTLNEIKKLIFDTADNITDELLVIITNYTEAFNKMNKNKGFIETVEREDIYVALCELIDLIPNNIEIDKNLIFDLFDSKRDF